MTDLTPEDHRAAQEIISLVAGALAEPDGCLDPDDIAAIVGAHRLAHAVPGDAIHEAIKHAYLKGATDVHSYWTENPGEAPRGDPEFGEAANDYASAAMDPFDSSAFGPGLSISPVIDTNGIEK